MSDTQHMILELARERYGKFFPDQCWETFPLETAIDAIQKSGEFDVEGYMKENPDIIHLGMDPVTHWLKYGLAEGRSLKRKDLCCERPATGSVGEQAASPVTLQAPEKASEPDVVVGAAPQPGAAEKAQVYVLDYQANESLNAMAAQAARKKFSTKLASIPGMMTGQDCAIYVYYAGKYNQADMIDAGCFIGCTTQCILDGAFAGENTPAQLKVFDLFIPDDATKDWLKRRCGEEAGRLANFRPLFEKNMGVDLGKVEIHEGDIVASAYKQTAPVSFLGIDLCKSAQLTDTAVRKFFPALIPGNSIVVHQDYIHPWLPHIHISMELLNSFFEPELEGNQANCYAFKPTQPITESDINKLFGKSPESGQLPEWYCEVDRNLQLLDRAYERMLYKNSKIQIGLAKAVYLREMGGRQEAIAQYRKIKAEYGDLGYTCGCERMFMDEIAKTPSPDVPVSTPAALASVSVKNSKKDGWAANLSLETAFWSPIISGTYPNKDRCEFMRKFSQPMECAPVCLHPQLRRARRILDVGAGPVSVLGSHLDGKPLNITAIDPLAREYAAEFEKAGYAPLVKTQYGVAEELEKYVDGLFDVIFSRNALDHGFDPVTAISKILDVCATGGLVRIENVMNEGEHENYVGLHQFNFMPEGNELIIWNREGYRKKLSEELAGKYDSFLVTKGPARWVYVEIGK